MIKESQSTNTFIEKVFSPKNFRRKNQKLEELKLWVRDICKWESFNENQVTEEKVCC